MTNPYASDRIIDQFKGTTELAFSESRNAEQVYSRNPMVAESKGARPPVYQADARAIATIPKVPFAANPRQLVRDIEQAKHREAMATLRFAATVNAIIPPRTTPEQGQAAHEARLLADYRKNHGDPFVAHLLGVLKSSDDWYVDQARQKLTALLASTPCNVVVNN